ncbi:hypothetical protein GGX14DRAFT_394450 [Mycena pura]|uniref:Uncharacterized protein n=1 Tax=Mycena pura TaxID=153505 RepID=A0AAD6VEQ8_9AGAR|nr:hypothetical protein GGX14DRAFT_394450 [Mycena pura]
MLKQVFQISGQLRIAPQLHKRKCFRATDHQTSATTLAGGIASQPHRTLPVAQSRGRLTENPMKLSSVKTNDCAAASWEQTEEAALVIAEQTGDEVVDDVSDGAAGLVALWPPPWMPPWPGRPGWGRTLSLLLNIETGYESKSGLRRWALWPYFIKATPSRIRFTSEQPTGVASMLSNPRTSRLTSKHLRIWFGAKGLPTIAIL